MRLKRCIKPGCGCIHNEDSAEFADGFCDCGAVLEDYKVVPGPVETPQPPQIGEEQSDEGLDEEVVEQVGPVEDELGCLGEEEEKEKEKEKPRPETEEEKTELEPLKMENLDESPTYIVTKDMRIVYRDDAQFSEELKAMNAPLPVDTHRDFTGDRIEMYVDGTVYKTIPFVFDELLIGRESSGEMPDIDYTGIDEERFISRRHALIYRQKGQFIIRNVSSKNTVHVNRQSLAEKEEVVLTGDEKIILSRKFGLVFKRENDGELL